MEAQRAAEKEDGVEQALENGSAVVGMVERLHVYVLAWKQMLSLLTGAMASVTETTLQSTWSSRHSAGNLLLIACSFLNKQWPVLWRIFNGTRGKGTRMSLCETFSP